MPGQLSVDAAVIGLGRLGTSLCATLHRAGLHVGVAGIELDSSPMISLAATRGFPRLGIVEAATTARVVIIADPRDTIAALLIGLGPVVPSATFVDATVGDAGASRTEAIRARVNGASVYRVLCPEIDDAIASPDVFYIGPNEDERDGVEGIIGRTGRRPVYLGGYERARVIDYLVQSRRTRRTFEPAGNPTERLLAQLN